MASLPLVTVRIPAHNHERFIERCLDSVLEDDYPHKELVIIDDGSTDRTGQKIRSWIERHADALPIRYSSRENRGICATLNELIAMSSGEYLVSLASDDYLLPGGIRKRLEYLQAHPEKDAVIGDCIVVDEQGLKLYDSGLAELHRANKENYLSDDGLRYEIIWNWSIPGPVLMVRSSLYRQIGTYDPRLKVEDWDLYLRMVSKDLLGFVDTPVSVYRVHADQTCRSLGSGISVNKELLWSGLYNLTRFDGRWRVLLARKTLHHLWRIVKKRKKRIVKKIISWGRRRST